MAARRQAGRVTAGHRTVPSPRGPAPSRHRPNGTERVITTAAAILIVVFNSFVIDPDPTVKMLAIGMAFAVLIDASLVRMALVPSIMALLGAHAWWLPRWLEPVVPDLQLEGSVAEPAEPERI
jgi:putative drug exporter of the RND superfamily